MVQPHEKRKHFSDEAKCHAREHAQGHTHGGGVSYVSTERGDGKNGGDYIPPEDHHLAARQLFIKPIPWRRAHRTNAGLALHAQSRYGDRNRAH